ncbi:hypothetical protein [Leuconostoc mesenteroides]|nr:hypothetical protein [Leuconostoc mesenteroides]
MLENMKNIRGKRQPMLFVATAVAFSLVVFSSGSSSKVLVDFLLSLTK